MTTEGADAAQRAALANGRKALAARLRMVGLTGALLLSAALAGCGSSNLLSADGPVQSATPVPASQPTAATPAPRGRVALAPVMGAPEAVSKQVGSQLGSALERQRVGVAQGGDSSDYTLRSYMVATRERSATKVSYIFDLTDPSGKRLNRIQGEELAQGGDARDPWSALTPEVSQRITDKAASSLATALGSLAPGSNSSASPAESAAPPPVGVGAGAVTPAASPVATPPAASNVAAAANTGSINRTPSGGGLAVIIPAVTGAPGDGNTALAAAMRQEMQSAGLGSAGPGQRAYSVAGKVAVGAPKEGKQSVKIDWRVTDPAGALLATVSQNNDIQAGTLDGQWGGIANDAAQGAASRIKELIDESQASAGSPTRQARPAPKADRPNG